MGTTKAVTDATFLRVAGSAVAAGNTEGEGDTDVGEATATMPGLPLAVRGMAVPKARAWRTASGTGVGCGPARAGAGSRRKTRNAMAASGTTAAIQRLLFWGVGYSTRKRMANQTSPMQTA